jgi:hypothetical protein
MEKTGRKDVARFLGPTGRDVIRLRRWERQLKHYTTLALIVNWYLVD